MGEPSFELAVELGVLVVASRLLLPLIQGLVEYTKRLGAKGIICVVEAMVFGVVLGGFYYLAAYGPPEELFHWFALVIMSLLLGLAAAGDYDLQQGGGVVG